MNLQEVLTNVYFYMACTSVVAVVAVLVLLAQRAESSTTVKWFHVYVWGMLVTSIGQLLLFFGEKAEVFDFAQTTTSVGVIFIIFGLFYFVLHYLEMRSWIESYWLSFSMIVIASYGFIISLHSRLFYVVDPSLRVRYPWGYFPSEMGKYYYPGYVSWTSGLHLLSVVLLILAWRRTTEPRRKRQMLLIICGLMFPFIVVTITYNVLPLFNLHVLPAATYSEAIMGAVLTYALLRYGTAALDPAAITASVVRTMNSAALALDSQYRIVLANAAAGEFVGRTADQLVGENVRALVAADKWADFEQQILQASRKGESKQAIESAIVAKSGKDVAVNVYSSPYSDKRKQNIGTILVFADIQKLKDLLGDANRLGRELAEEKKNVEAKVIERTHELNVERAKLQAAIQSLPVGFILIDAQGHVAVHNPVLRRIMGVRRIDTSLRALADKCEGIDLVAACQQVQETGKSLHFDEVSLGTRILRIFIGPVRVHEEEVTTAVGSLVLVEDTTEEKVLARSRDEFFSIASHELRTPLTAIRGNASMMITMYEKLISKEPQLNEMTHDIYEGANRLISIVNDFIDVSRVEQGKMHFQPKAFAMDKVIERVMYEMRSVVQEKNIHVQTNIATLGRLPQAWADEDRVTQVVYNLIGNAIKFTEKGTVTIDAVKEGGHIKVLVSDTGRGIPVENQKLLFRKFQQAGKSLLTRDTTRGTGLGLYISKLIMENMNGTIRLDHSEEGKGSVFSFTVPIATEDQLLPKTAKQ